ncbi:MAG TPA: VOC family protein [Candidatus Acidoferrales bacterium]|nr:VOC family protein [Candidatus Acidoferrales bacterium]
MGNPVVHFEVTGRDGKALKSFYQQLFAWEIDSSNPMNYGMVKTGSGIGGGIGAGDGSEESSWVTFYVEVEDPQATLDQVEQLGGKVQIPVMDVPGGPTMAQFRDPEGHLIGLVKAEDHAHPHE